MKYLKKKKKKSHRWIIIVTCNILTLAALSFSFGKKNIVSHIGQSFCIFNSARARNLKQFKLKSKLSTTR